MLCCAEGADTHVCTAPARRRPAVQSEGLMGGRLLAGAPDAAAQRGEQPYQAGVPPAQGQRAAKAAGQAISGSSGAPLGGLKAQASVSMLGEGGQFDSFKLTLLQFSFPYPM